MNFPRGGPGILTKGVPAVIGIGIAWIGIKMIRNEKQLLLRRLELEEMLINISHKKKEIELK
tara:strand:+ start:472 stop:657 length:186 start_codon:yes stop_codon:yes gene_type:complete